MNKRSLLWTSLAWWILLVCGVFPAFAQDQTSETAARLVPVEGDAIDGNLVRADEQKIRFRTADGTSEWASQQVLRIDVVSKAARSGVAPLELGLLDGSRLKGMKLVGKEQAWQFGDSSGGMIEIGPGVVKSLLVRNLNRELAQAWSDALQEPAETDSLILLRPGDTVDRIGGIISEVKDGKVAFDLDGQVIDVAFDKLVGMIWFRKPQDRIKPNVEIQFIDGGALLVEAFVVEGTQITYRSILGKGVSQPMSRVASFNYASANLKWLADIPMLESVAQRRMDWKGAAGSVDKVLAPRFVSSGGTDVGSQSNAEDLDLVFPSAGSMTFRVPEGFSKLKARIERSGRGELRSEVMIEVVQDGERLALTKLETSQEALDIELSLTSGKKVTLIVGSEGRMQIGTEVTWKQPRLLR
ncbi:MAG: hypothetical protein MUF23_16250 [Pirellula sp.]|nr:hypothetical protein [Pirellula sp.]